MMSPMKQDSRAASIGLVLFTHAGLASAFVQAIEMVTGPQPRLLAVAVDAGVAPAELEARLERAIEEADGGAGVIVMTDLFGGSPANLSLARMVPGRVEVVSGLNLAMVLKAVDLRRRELCDPAVMARAVVREGRENISLASDLLQERTDLQPERSAGGADCR
jgi:PTS system mannose-specific IIA component